MADKQIYNTVFTNMKQELFPNSSLEKFMQKLNMFCTGIFVKIKDCEEGVILYAGLYCIQVHMLLNILRAHNKSKLAK
jgi:hypothetical protein